MTLRARTARGTLVNGAFLIGTNALNLIKGLAVAIFLTSSQYGSWGLLMAAFMTLLTLGSVGVDDKYIQQDHPDQRAAFEIALTFQAVVGVVFFCLVLVGMPLFALLYGRPEIVAPGMTFALALPALVLQMPLWVHYRRMDFVRQRSLQAIDPVISLIAVITLAAVGLGLWAFVLGELVGTWCAAIVIARSSPFPLRLRWDRKELAEYTRFSWPLLLAAISAVLLVQVPVVVSARVLGVVAVGGIALATNISQFTTRVDDIVTQTLYPAICAVKERTDLLFEAFWKSNRLALLWAVPLGGAAALFAGDFVHYVIGEKWRFAVPLIITFGIAAALNQVGFNWTAFFRARGNTRPAAVESLVGLAAVMAIAIPLLATKGLTAFGVGLIIATGASVAVRLSYLRSIFPALALAGHIASAIGPTLPAVAAVLGLRGFGLGHRSPLQVALETALYATLVIAVTLGTQRRLLGEVAGYVRGRSSPGEDLPEALPPQVPEEPSASLPVIGLGADEIGARRRLPSA
jgi:O-antigen/teichoic acid export membrane protein